MLFLYCCCLNDTFGRLGTILKRSRVSFNFGGWRNSWPPYSPLRMMDGGGALVSRTDSLLKCLLQLSLATRGGGQSR